MNSDILYFNIRSKECQQLSNNADLIVSLPFSIDIEDDEWLQIEVISAEIPLSFYNISSALENNIFSYTKNGGDGLIVAVNLTVPNGNYTVDSLLSTMNGLQNDFVMSYSDVFNKFLINANVQYMIFTYQTSNYSQQIFGIINNQTIPALTPAYFGGVCNLASVHSLLVRSSLNSGNSASTSQSNNDIIQKISLDVNYGGMIILNQNSVIRKNIIKSGSIKQFYLKLTEQNQKIIDLNSCNWEMSLLFTKIKHDMNTVSPEQQERRKSNYIQEQPTQPTQPIQPIANNYQPVSSYSSSIGQVQESAIQPMNREANALPTQRTPPQILASATPKPQTNIESSLISQIPLPKTVENEDNNGLDNQNKQDNPYDNLYDLLNDLILE